MGEVIETALKAYLRNSHGRFRQQLRGMHYPILIHKFSKGLTMVRTCSADQYFNEHLKFLSANLVMLRQSFHATEMNYRIYYGRSPSPH